MIKKIDNYFFGNEEYGKFEKLWFYLPMLLMILMTAFISTII